VRSQAEPPRRGQSEKKKTKKFTTKARITRITRIKNNLQEDRKFGKMIGKKRQKLSTDFSKRSEFDYFFIRDFICFYDFVTQTSIAFFFMPSIFILYLPQVFAL